MTLLFRPGSRVAPAAWPCPRAKEGPAGCRKRFWSDAEKRRSTRLPDTARKFEDTRDTFACRFYQRLSGSSPCDLARKSFRIRLYDGFGNAIPFAPFMAKIGSGDFSALSRADAEGHITLRDVEVPASCVIQWGVQPEEGQSVALVFSRTIFLVGDDETGPPAASKQLNNLGYDGEDQRQNVLGFQLDYGHLATPPLSPTGELDERTLELLATVYRQSAAALGDTVVA
jgi:hypothetical protein